MQKIDDPPCPLAGIGLLATSARQTGYLAQEICSLGVSPPRGNIIENTETLEQGEVLERPRHAETGELLSGHWTIGFAINRYMATIRAVDA